MEVDTNIPFKKRKKDVVTKECLLTLSKEDLVDQLLQLQAHNEQLKNIIQKRQNDGNCQDQLKSTGSRNRPFDFSKHHKRHILLRILYVGWDYQGYATQEDTTSTIEHHLFAALTKACLIENRQTSNYHRCGRTDKGVSSFGQVISIDVRSKLSEDHAACTDIHKELPYCKILNRLLPEEIRAISWRPMSPNFSARFDCNQRSYKYYFPRGNLNIDAMNHGAQFVVGTHDFRNFCKMDVANGVVNYIRKIESAEIKPSEHESEPYSEYTMMVFSLRGSAFIWHQVRCITGILLLIGQGLEEPEIVQQLLDVDSHPRKPQYSMASELPLNLFQCLYPFDESEWLVDSEALAEVERTVQKSWTHSAVKATMVRDMLLELSKMQTEVKHQSELSSCLLQGIKSKIYKPLLSRPTCESLESRIEHYAKKLKMDSKSAR